MTKSRLVPVEGLPRIHGTPLASVAIEGSTVIVELDDVNERRIRLLFQPYQAVLMTTADCFDPPGSDPVPSNTVVEVRESAWIDALTERLTRADATATFMRDARHFLVPLQDDFLEVVAWAVTWESVDG